MIKIPRKVLADFGDFIVQHNKMDYKLKMFLAGFVEDNLIGHLLVGHQNFVFIKKRVNSIFEHMIEDSTLKQRWKGLQTEMTELNEIRNDIAHSIVDYDPKAKELFLLTRFSEKSVLHFSQKERFYEFSELKSYVARQKKLNTKLSFFFHTTFKKHHEIVFYDGKGMMF